MSPPISRASFCCFHRSPDWAIWQNYEVVEFQPRSGIATILDSVTSITTNYIPARPTCLRLFMDHFIYLLPSTTPPSVAFVFVSPLSWCNTHAPPHLLAWYVVHLELAHHLHSPTSATSLSSPQHVPASDAMSCAHLSPIFCPWPVPRSLSAPVGAPLSGTCVSLVSLPLPPCMIHEILSSSGAWYMIGWKFSRAKARGPGVSTP